MPRRVVVEIVLGWHIQERMRLQAGMRKSEWRLWGV